MPSSSEQLNAVVGSLVTFMIVVGVAAMMRKVLAEDTGLEFLPSISPRAKRPLVEKYGLWAVNRAEAFCPQNDVECVEREAKRAYQVYRQRRGLT